MSACGMLAAEAFDPFIHLSEFTAQAEGMGAIASFVGVARATSKAGRPVSALFLDHHERLTAGSVEQIAEQTLSRIDVAHTLVVHRTGIVGAGEPIVLVAAASAHRRAALQAVDYMMDRLKTDAMFWKRERYDDGGGSWIEPSGQDYEDRSRWR